MKFHFRKLFLAVPFLACSQKNLRTSWWNGCSYKKNKAGWLAACLTRQAASALLELSSSTLSSWRGLCQGLDWAPHQLGARALAPWACSWSLQGHEPNSAASSTSGSSKRFFCHQWLVCSDVLACSWWTLEGLLAAAQNRPISYQKVLVSSAACRHSCLENNRPSACCRSCQASVEDRLWNHDAIGRWAYQVKKEEEEQIIVVLFVNEN
jgi:hypothetical protein